MFFIVSTGRSGTMTLAETISLIKDCTCLHEPSPELILESSAYHYGKFPHEELKELFFQTRRSKAGESVYCESSQTLSLIIPVITDVFPEARFIWLIRNGLDVVASAYQKQWYTGHSENHDRYEDCPPIEKAWIDGRIQGDRCGAMSSEEWISLERFGKCCWYWSYVNTVIEKELNKYSPGNFFIVKLETINEHLKDLIEWMGLRAAIVPAVRRFNPAKREPYHWSRWSESEKSTFERYCAPLMDRFYPSWRSSTGSWKGIRYHTKNGYLNRIRTKYDFIRRVTRFF